MLEKEKDAFPDKRNFTKMQISYVHHNYSLFPLSLRLHAQL